MGAQIINPAREGAFYVLRCPPDQTLSLEQYFLTEGFHVWVPKTWIKKRRPRRRASTWEQVALMTSYIFAEEEEIRLDKKVQAQIVRRMLFLGEWVSVFEKDLAYLRELDSRGMTKEEPVEAFRPGERVVLKGLLDGYQGQIEEILHSGYYRVVLSRSFQKVEISGFLLARMGV